MSKKNNDLLNGLGKLVLDSKDRKENNVGKTIINTHVTPDYHDKQTVLVSVDDLYAAPKMWNFYDPLDDNKKLELIESIEENGILSPIVVWEVDRSEVSNSYAENEVDMYGFKGKRYLILAGHNRSDAMNKLSKVTNNEKYTKIPALIYKKEELTELSAREIIVDTNYVQRILSVKEMEESIMYKYDEVENNQNRKGRTRDIVAEELGIGSSKVSEYRKLHAIYPPLKQLVYTGNIALSSMLKIANKTYDTQKWLFETYGEILDSAILNKITPSMKKGNIDSLIQKEIIKRNEKNVVTTKKVSIDVPNELVREFKEMCSKWIYDKTKR